MSNDVKQLRAFLFDALRGIQSGEVDIDRAKAINETAQTIINTAKVEIDHIRVAGGTSEFVMPEHNRTAELAPGQTAVSFTHSGRKTASRLADGTLVTTHKMAD